MNKKIPKLALRQGIREKTPPPLIKWDLSEIERERWEALNMHHKAFSKKDMKTMTNLPEYLDKETFFQSVSEFTPRLKSVETEEKNVFSQEINPVQKKFTSSSQTARPMISLSQQVYENFNAAEKRPLLMPRLEVEDSQELPPANTMLEQAERSAASEPIDQNSLRFQVKLRKNLESIHEADLQLREEQWKEKISKTRDDLERLKKRNRELEEVMKKYLFKKGNESEGSKEISRLIELKAKVSDEINEFIAKKSDLEKKINELHQELERNTFNFEAQEKSLINELESLHKQVTMSENEKVDSVVFNKENLKKRKEELLSHKQELIEKWQSENLGFKEIFQETDQKKNEIRQKVKLLKSEKEILKNEKEILKQKEENFKQEREVAENNKKTFELFRSFNDPSLMKNFEVLKEIISKTAQNIMKKNQSQSDFEPNNEYSEYLSSIKIQHKKRKNELLLNSTSQLRIISQQIEEEQLKKSKSLSNLSLLKKYVQK